MLFAAVHESVVGTKRTSPSCRWMSASGGRAEVVGRQRNRRDWPTNDILGRWTAGCNSLAFQTGHRGYV